MGKNDFMYEILQNLFCFASSMFFSYVDYRTFEGSLIVAKTLEGSLTVSKTFEVALKKHFRGGEFFGFRKRVMYRIYYYAHTFS